MKTLITAAAVAAVFAPLLVAQAPPANACAPGFSMQTQSPLLGPQCAPDSNAQNGGSPNSGNPYVPGRAGQLPPAIPPPVNQPPIQAPRPPSGPGEIVPPDNIDHPDPYNDTGCAGYGASC